MQAGPHCTVEAEQAAKAGFAPPESEAPPEESVAWLVAPEPEEFVAVVPKKKKKKKGGGCSAKTSLSVL